MTAMPERRACGKCQQLINDYADRRLSGRKLALVEAHLAWCVDCRDALAQIERLRRELREAPAPAPAPTFWQRCECAIAASAEPRQWPTLRARVSSLLPAWKPALAAVVTIIVLGLAVRLPSAFRAGALSGAPAVQAETPNAEFIMQHEAFVAAQPLSATSHYVLATARAAEEDEDRGGVGDSKAADSFSDADAPGE
jgi:anti-sigma factor RsiW